MSYENFLMLKEHGSYGIKANFKIKLQNGEQVILSVANFNTYLALVRSAVANGIPESKNTQGYYDIDSETTFIPTAVENVYYAISNGRASFTKLHACKSATLLPLTYASVKDNKFMCSTLPMLEAIYD